MNTSPSVRKKAPSATTPKSFVISLIAKEAAVLRMRTEALQQTVSAVEKAARGPHPPGPGPTGDQFAALYQSLGKVLESAGALQKPIADLMKTTAEG